MVFGGLEWEGRRGGKGGYVSGLRACGFGAARSVTVAGRLWMGVWIGYALVQVMCSVGRAGLFSCVRGHVGDDYV